MPESPSLESECDDLRRQLKDALLALAEADLLRKELSRLEIITSRKRIHDGYKLPSGAYEALQDLARIEECLRIMQSLWSRGHIFDHATGREDNVRKACIHLSRHQWQLQKTLNELCQ